MTLAYQKQCDDLNHWLKDLFKPVVNFVHQYPGPLALTIGTAVFSATLAATFSLGAMMAGATAFTVGLFACSASFFSFTHQQAKPINPLIEEIDLLGEGLKDKHNPQVELPFI